MALVAIGVIAAVAYTLRPRETVAPPPPIEKLDPKEKIVTIGGDAIQLKGARQDLKIEFERQATYQDGQTKLFDVKVLASNRSGRDYTITGKEAQVGKDESSFEVKGDVKLETSDGLDRAQRAGHLLGRREDRPRAGAGQVLPRPHERHRRRASTSTSSATC